MKTVILGLLGLLSISVFAQESEVVEEFLPINMEGKEAFMSTKTGEFTYREHSKTDPSQLKTTASGVVYTDVTTHTVKKGETLSAIAKKERISVLEIKQYNKLTTNNLKIGQPLKIVKKTLIKSSSPVVGYSGEERIIASLRPGENPAQFAVPPSVAEVESEVIKTKKTEEKPKAVVYKAETSVKNPIFGLDNNEDESLENLSEAINKELKEATEASKTTEVITETLKDETKTKSKIEKQPEVLTEQKAEHKTETKEQKLERLKAEVYLLKQKLAEEKNKKTTVEVIKAPSEKETTITKVPQEKVLVKNNKQLESNQFYHRVVKGNTLYNIAKKYNMTLKALIKLNNLRSNKLSIGQKLKVIKVNK